MDKLLKQFSIAEISQKTHISPLILEKLKNNDFSKLTKIKLIGFVKILEEEYPNYDFSKLKTKIEEYFDTSKQEIADIALQTKPENNSFKTYLLVLILLVAISGLVYYMQTHQKKHNVITKHEKNISFINTIEDNITPIKEAIEVNESNETNQSDVVIKNSDITKDIKKEINSTLAIIPLKKVWFKATYLDDLKSKEYLTAKEIELNGSRPIFIKFGHGLVTLKYYNQTLTPNTKKVIRVIIRDKNMSVTTKRLGAFK